MGEERRLISFTTIGGLRLGDRCDLRDDGCITMTWGNAEDSTDGERHKMGDSTAHAGGLSIATGWPRRMGKGRR